MDGIVLCGIRNLRVWLGPLPTWICVLHGQISHMIVFEFSFFMFFIISLARFMFICIWKRMREMNDDLIVKIALNCSVFLSVWTGLTDFTLIGGRNIRLCSGDFSNSSMKMDWHEMTKPKIRDLPR